MYYNIHMMINMQKDDDFMEILTLGEKIKARRKELDMTLKELAGDRITPGQISLVESGKSKPSIDLLGYIAQKLGTDVDYFLESEEKQAAKICEFYVDIAESYLDNKNIMDTNEAISKGMYYAQKYNLSYYKGKFDMLLSRLKILNGDFEQAQQYCLSANSIFLKLESVDDVIKSFMILGIITYKMGYYTTALNYFIQSDNIMNEYNHINELLRAEIYYYFAMCYNQSNNIQQAINYSLLARDRLKSLNNKKEYAKTLMILSISYGKQNKIKEAIKYAGEARKIFNEVNEMKEIADIETNLGIIFAKGDNLEESFAHLNKALKIKKDIKDSSICDTVFGLCDNYITTCDFNKAEETIKNVMKNLDSDNYRCRIRCFEYLYKIYEHKNEKKKCEEVLISAIKFIEPLKEYKKELANFYILLGKFYDEIGEKDFALNYINKGLDSYKELGIILNN